jgi:glycosyltransferase involved in cell wall biosynthesis
LDAVLLAGLRQRFSLAALERSAVNVSVIVPVYNAGSAFRDCLQSLFAQTLPRAEYEVVIVDDGSTDGSAALAEQFPAKVIRQRNAGAPAARNTGISAARGTWLAFTDSDCITSRRWLETLLRRVQAGEASVGAAGRTTGFQSQSPAARFVDLMGGLDASTYLRHPRFPFAPTANLLYRADYVRDVGGFDTRYATYDACDLHTRLLARYAGPFYYEPAALVLHRHRDSWKRYWRQQYFYGVGYAQFLLAHRRRAPWRVRHQVAALAAVARHAVSALLPARGDAAVVRHGRFIRAAAQQAGFLRTYYNRAERLRW